ncbi:hypothetical protein PR003_g11057 [Phytophthora rubi]|uniref:Thioredoxin domain-containing protein n=1 Tax=Phytophthora rubi TaxID=129364 RepID=A0A6A4FHQ7_9STRA|nr:hypothetical protein PR003_g11057 [Phytophthora rubi]
MSDVAKSSAQAPKSSPHNSPLDEHADRDQHRRGVQRRHRREAADGRAVLCAVVRRLQDGGPKVNKLMESEFSGVKFLKVSAEELEDFCEEIDVDSFPTFRVYKNGEVAASYVSSKFEKVEAFIRENAN